MQNIKRIMNKSSHNGSGSIVQSYSKEISTAMTLEKAKTALKASINYEILSVAMPVSIKAGVIQIECKSSVVAQEITLNKEKILDFLKSFNLGLTIKGLRCVIKP